MRKITEVLRLRAAGMNSRAIAASIGAGKTTVYEYLARAEAAGVAWALPEGMDEEALDAKLFPPPSGVLAARRPVPDWRAVHRELKRKHVTLRLLWLEWRADNPEGWGYTQFCAHYQGWLGVQDVVMPLTWAAGERMFVDFSGDRAAFIDPGTGEAVAAEVFVTVLGAGGMLYAEATRSQDLGSWIGAHIHAWEYYGRGRRVTVPDNLRAGVTKACWYDPELNPSYAELARHYDTVVLPMRVAHPRDEAAVEAGVLSVERLVLAPLRNRRFFSLAELNEAMAEQGAAAQCPGVPGPAHVAPGAVRRAGALRPQAAADAALRARLLEEGDGQHRLPRRVRPPVLLRALPAGVTAPGARATATTVEVFRAGRRVASRAREHGRRRFVTDPAHMPASHRARRSVPTLR